MELEKRYNKLWAKSLQHFENGVFQFDDLIDSDADNRYGITLLARPNSSVKQAVSQTLQEIKSIAPGQYYYPASDLHLTVLSIISCYPGFTVDKINPVEYCNVIQAAVQTIQPFHVKFQGLTASPSCILIRGFPQDNTLTKLRNALRNKFQHAELQHSIDKRYKLQTAHLTAVRFKQPLTNADSFVRKIKNLKDQPFGRCTINQLELVGNDWYQRKARVQLLKSINLNG